MPVKSDGFYDNKEQIQEASNMLFLKKGVTQVRVLPAYSEKGRWYRQIKEIPLHINGKYSPVVSPATNGDPCPFEREGRRLYNLKGEENIELAKRFRPRNSFLFNVVVMEWPDEFDIDIEQCVKVLKCGIKVKEQILDFDQDHSGGWGDITSLEKGFNLRITRAGQGRNDTTYTVKGVPGRTNILDWLDEKGFTQELRPHNLDDLYQPPSAEEMEELLVQFKAELDLPIPGDGGDPFRDVRGNDDIPSAPVTSDHRDAPSLGGE